MFSQHVDPAEAGQRSCHHGLGGAGHAEVEDRGGGVGRAGGAAFGLRRGKLLGGPLGDEEQAKPLRRQGLRRGPADAARGAGEESDPHSTVTPVSRTISTQLRLSAIQ